MDRTSSASTDAGSRQQVEAALEAVERTPTEQREALERALAISSAALDDGTAVHPSTSPADSPPGTAAADEERRRWWLAARLRLLQHVERLDTALALSGGAWSPEAYAALRDCTVADAAAALARAGRLAALPLLLQRHPRALLPSLLDALACVPETEDVKHYAPLLRQVAALRQAPPLQRAPDWAETAPIAAGLREQGRYALLLATEPMAEVSGGWSPPTQRQLAAWACERAQRLDAATGQLPNAIALLEAAQAALHYGEPAVGALLAAAQELLSLLKLAASRGDGSTWRMGLREHAALGPRQRLTLLLGLLGSDDLSADLSQLVAPALARLGGSGDDAVDAQLVLRQALELEAARRLPWVVRVVQAEARQRCVFSSAAQLAKTAAACCYACTATDAWELLSSMLSAARDTLRADHSLPPEQRQAAEDALESVRGHVTAARLLTKHGLTTAVCTVRDADRGAALRTLRTLLARSSRTRNSGSRWVDLWMDLRTIREHGFTQLSEEDVRSELCRTLLRVGQHRLAASYLEGLPPPAAEALVLAAAREAYLAASGMADPAVAQAKECLALLPSSDAAWEQLASIVAAEQLQRAGLDLPPLQLQQLQERAANGDGAVLEQLLKEHPHLASADSRTLGQLAAALGLAQAQQPLLLRAAEAAHASGQRQRATSLLLQLAAQHYKPAWQLAAAVAAQPTCASSARRQLLAFALSAAPAEQLLQLLLQWQAADGAGGSSCWDLFSAAESASSSSTSHEQQRQQAWMEQQLRGHLATLSSSSSSGSGGGSSSGADSEAAALGCLLALGQRGLKQWEQLLGEQQQRPLSYGQRRRALLLGLTAAALLALQPEDVEPAALAEAVAAAEARLAAAPAQLLQQLQQRAASLGPQPALSEEQAAPSGPASEAGESAGGSTTPTPRAVIAASAAKAATAAAERFHTLLLSAADVQHLQALLPGVDAAAALAGGSAGRRRLVLELAAAAGRPPAAPAPAASASPSASGMSGGAASPRSPRRAPLLRRASSRKKVEAVAAGWGGSVAEPAEPASPRGPAGRQLSEAAAGGQLQQALQLAAKFGVPAWEVQLAFVESLLLHNQRGWQPRGAHSQLLAASLPPLLAGQKEAAAALQALLLRVWPRASSQHTRHFAALLQAVQQCSAVLVADQVAAALSASCQAAEQLTRAASGIDAKLFLQPLLQLAAATLAGSDSDAAAALASATEQLPANAAALAQQLLQHVSSSNAQQLSAAVGALAQQHAAAAGGQAGTLPGYPCSSSTPHLALFCKALAAGAPDPAAMHTCQLCLQHMAPADAAAAAAFAAAGAPCPLPLPAGEPQLAPAPLSGHQQEQLLAAGLAVLDSSDAAAAMEADSRLRQLAEQLQRQHALLVACSSIAAACHRAQAGQADAVAAAAAALQQQKGSEASSEALSACLQQLITTGCPAGAVLQAAAVLQALQQQPQRAPPPAAYLLAQPAAATEAQAAVSTAAEAATAAALQALSGSAGAQPGQSQLSAGDAVQNLFALLRSLHPLPDAASMPAGGSIPDAAAQAAAAATEAVGVLRLHVWQLLQQQAASYDGSGSAAETDAHLQVLELLGSIGSSSLWPGWQPPSQPPPARPTEEPGSPAGSAVPGSPAALPGPSPAAAASAPAAAFKHHQALLFTRTAAALAVDWPAAVQQCRLSAADFADAEAAEAALLRVAAAAQDAEQLRLLLRLLLDVLTDGALPSASADPAAAEGVATAAGAGAAASLHRVWAACLRALLALGDLSGALASLDERHAQRAERAHSAGAPAPPLTAPEAEALAEAADATQGPAAAAALALLLPHASLQRARWQQLLQACSGSGSAADLASALPGLDTLLLLVTMHQPALLAELASGGRQQQALLQQLAAAALAQQQQAGGGAYARVLGGGLTLRTVVAAACAAHLASARQYATASWLAMQALGTPRLLRVLDSSPRVLQQLLRSCAPGSPAAAAAEQASEELAAGASGAPPLAAPWSAAALLRGLAEACGGALERLNADLGLH